ncbi:hypothetical protein RYX36_003554 [Vicia faba]
MEIEEGYFSCFFRDSSVMEVKMKSEREGEREDPFREFLLHSIEDPPELVRARNFDHDGVRKNWLGKAKIISRDHMIPRLTVL